MKTVIILIPLILIIFYLIDKNNINWIINAYSKKRPWVKIVFKLLYYFIVFIVSLYIFVVYSIFINNIFWYFKLEWIIPLLSIGLIISYFRFSKKIGLYLVLDTIALTNIFLVLSITISFFQEWSVLKLGISSLLIYISLMITILASQLLSYWLRWFWFLVAIFIIFYIFLWYTQSLWFFIS